MNRSVWFPGDLAERVQARAGSLGRSFNWVVARALESALRDTSGTQSGTPDVQPRGPAVDSAPSSASTRASAATDVESLARMDRELGSGKVLPEDWSAPATSDLERKALKNISEQAANDLERSIKTRRDRAAAFRAASQKGKS